MVDWAMLHDVYGSAEQVPSLLKAAEQGDDSAWHELWSRLCHQGTVSNASFAALPELAAMAERHPAAGYVPPLGLAASIISASDRPLGFDSARDRYAVELGALRSLAERSVNVAKDSGDFVYALQFLMAFEGVPVWQNHLESLADKELQVSCPNCDEYLYVALGDPDFKARLATSREGAVATPLAPAEPNGLPSIEARMHNLAIDRSQGEVAVQMLYLFGHATCPNCNHTFLIPQALAAEVSPQS
jgi:hypothetical protein